MKKGFTLIELLAVIVILAVILVIAIPQVLKVVDNSRINAYIKNEQMVLKAVDLYVSRNTGELPGEVGSTTEVSINYLVENGMLTEITNPYNKNEDCTGYVTIMKLSDTEYDYTPHLKCGLDINNSSDDGLVAHYKFDNFQEPTENLLSGPFANYIDRAQTKVVADISVEANTTYTLRGYVNNEEGSTSARVRADRFSGSTLVSYGGSNNVNVGSKGYSGETFTTESNVDRIVVRTQTYTGYEDGITYFSNIQLEQKGYPTPFVEGSRQGVVKDYSGNDNNANLDLNTTPRWLYNEERNSGVYEFDNKRIIIGTGNTFFPLDNFSISAWIKTPGLGSGMSRNGIISITYGLTVFLNASGNLTLRMDNGTSLNSIGVTKPLHDNEFHHILVSFDGVNQRIYIDGELMRTSAFNGWTGSTRWPTNTAVIGQENNNASIYRFNGLIDDVRIYNRALSDREVKLLYESTK